MNNAYLAFDLGAESGRAMLGVLESGKLTLEEVHRFPNKLQPLDDGLHWDIDGLWNNLVEGLKKAGETAASRGLQIVSLGVDTWGVDYGLIDAEGKLVIQPFAYRDERNPPAMDKAVKLVGEKRLYEVTGIQFMALNTLYQLVAQKDADPSVLDRAERLLFTPDLMHYLFTGKAVNEATIASTSQMLDPRTGQWATELLEALDLPTHFLGEIVPAGTVIGTIKPEIAEQAGVSAEIRVIAPAAHDTASAVAAVPADPETNWCYLSSGTWSLMGAELNEPLINERARAEPFTNEGGVNNTIRFLKNISGLWLVQECRRDFERRGKDYDYEQLTEMAREAEPFETLVDPDYEPFASPGDMLTKIDQFAEMTKQRVPDREGDYIRCCLESLALTYRRTLASLERVLDREFGVIHIVGGGTRNELLNQMTADATGKLVVAGPAEATAAGNVLTQAMGAGKLQTIREIRQTVGDSFDPKVYEPGDVPEWSAAYERYQQVVNRE